jgi:creatinine amidohydrolase
MPSVFLERMRWPEVAEALERGTTTVVIPCGAVEQHGPHLPLFVDAEHGTRLGAEVARRLGNALVAPTIRIGCSEHHMDFPGTITLRQSTFAAVCEDYCVSLARHGFKTLCLLPSHGGNFQPLANALPAIRDAVGPDCTVVAYTDLLAVLEIWRRVVDAVDGLGARVGGHADIAESSVMLVLHPELVAAEEAVDGFHPELEGEVIDRIIRDGFKSVTPTGVMGDARGMRAEIGEQCIRELADAVADYFGSVS